MTSTSTPQFELPEERKSEMRRAQRLEWISIFYLLSVIGLMYLVMGSSQAMKTAWVEDFLSLIPPIGFLIAARVRYRAPSEHYPYGYFRSINIAYFTSALALTATGASLLADGVVKLVMAEHPTIGGVSLFGRTVWLGWLMLPVLVWATVPAWLLGRAKLKPAKRLHDKPLYADAEMNKADWMTGTAAGAGVMGISVGWWWADAVAAIIISLDILWDGLNHVRAVVGDLMDRAPKSVDHQHFLDLPHRLAERLSRLPWVRHVEVRLREHGHVMFGEAYVVPVDEASPLARASEAVAAARELDWRLHDVCVQLVQAKDTSLAGRGCPAI
jgi:cation diffusion facilitator family transporter